MKKGEGGDRTSSNRTGRLLENRIGKGREGEGVGSEKGKERNERSEKGKERNERREKGGKREMKYISRN